MADRPGGKPVVTCLECGWYPLCEPDDIYRPCDQFIPTDELADRMGRRLHEVLTRHGADQSSDPSDRMDFPGCEEDGEVH
ncbi:MAG: hypothetical protein H5U10_01760 [Desulfacinum sp.]|nr:hypothetical protein [Desulfacinum sp.]